MRHRNKTVKLGRSQAHRDALLANQVCSLIEHSRIQTTLAKAKAVRPLAEKMLTLGKKATLHARRTALSVLRQKDAVKKLFDEIAPRSTERKGGYTRIIKLGYRMSDSAPLALIEWVDAPVVEEVVAPATDKKAKAKKAPATEAAAETTETKPKKTAARKPKAKAEDAEKESTEI
jgi:large subunit ribosomal protein L17